MNATTPTHRAALAPRPLRAGPVKRCPSCTAPLDGGPVRFRCEPCGRSVMAADLDTEYHPATPQATTPRSAAVRRAEPLDSAPAGTAPDRRQSA
ncbi:hypothetical protein E1264_35185 [Actinomadura sp. KC216]|uniref:hypothetical protein n=1 Tax=Actinomadura sp. KC216 TaxID=2530370 RepID=UPI00104E9771|nr:hypothetical protein [Actinomadura sp. KC216]TDB79670.1 hypothetical protein E1264_35185 [Actinomadura sp. KC216]